MTEWREVSLGEGLRVRHGYAFKGEFFSDRGEQIVLTPGNFVDSGGFKPKSGAEKFYAGPIPDAYVLRKGSVVVAMTEQGAGLLGSTATIPDEALYLHNQRIGLIEVTDPDLFDLRFVYHLMNSRRVRQQISATATGAKVRHTAPERIQRVRAFIPSISTQRAIGAVLDTVDDLIHNNERRAEALEEMARSVYREWFVRFRFPGHEDVEMVESSLGPIPIGWQVTTVSAVASIDKGLSYKGMFLTDSGVPMANLKSFARTGGFRRDGTKPYSGPFKPKHVVRSGDLVLANTDLTQAGGVIGSPAFIPRRGFEEGGIISHHLFAVRVRDLTLAPFLYEEFAGPTFRAYARGIASGTTVLGFRPADVLAYRIALPPGYLISRYAELASNVLRAAEEIRDSAETLSAIRDVILPQLVTGQIDVSSLDVEVFVRDKVA